MSIEFKDVTIDEKDFKIMQFGAVKAFKIQTKLIKKLAPIITSGIGIFDDSKTVDIEGAVKVLMSTLDPDDMFTLMLELLSMTSHNDSLIKQNEFDIIFKGNLLTAWKLIIEVIRFNYGDFFLLLEGANFGNLKDSFQMTTPKK